MAWYTEIDSYEYGEKDELMQCLDNAGPNFCSGCIHSGSCLILKEAELNYN